MMENPEHTARATTPPPKLAQTLFFAFVAAFAGAATAPSLAAAPTGKLTPEEIVRRSFDASHSLNVKGVETVVVPSPPRGSMVTLTRTIIRTKNGMCLIRWNDPNGRGGPIILDDGTWSKCYEPGSRELKVSRCVPRVHDAQSAARLTRILQGNYRITLEGKTQMAGRNCYVVRLTPYHSISHTVKLWIDTQNFYALSRLESNSRGDTVGLNAYNGIEFPESVPSSAFKNPFPANGSQTTFSRSRILQDLSQLRKQAGFELTVPYAMPGGYEFENGEILSLKGNTTTCLRYTDGIAEVTLYQSRSSEQRPAGYRQIQPMVDPLSNNCVDYRVGQMNFFIVGRTEMNGLLAITHMLNNDQERAFLSSLTQLYRVPLSSLADARNRGMNIDTMDGLLAVSAQTRRPLNTLIPLFRVGYCWMAIARMHNVDVKRLADHVRIFGCR